MDFKLPWTKLFIAFTVFAIMAYDIFALIKWGVPGTISAHLLSLAKEYPITSFGMGVLMGHLYWPNVDGDRVIK